MSNPGRMFTLALCAMPVLALGCGTSSPTSSTLTGTVDQASFPSVVTKITVVRSGSSRSTANVAKDGHFSISMAQDASYSFFLGADGQSTPLVLDDAHGTTTVHVKSGGAQVDLGMVRYWAGDPASGQAIVIAPTGSCKDGVIQGSGKPCSTGQASLVCTGDDGDGESDDDGETADDGEQAGVDCVDGLDAKTHAPCDGGPAANQNDGETQDALDPAAAAAIPEHSVPSELGCGDGDGETQDD